MFLDALTYPLRQDGWIVILIGAVLSVLLNFFQLAPLFGLLVAVFSAGYFGAFYLSIIDSTMTGRDGVPDWPSVGSFWDDIFSPLLRLIGLVLISFFPILLVAWFLKPSVVTGSIAVACLVLGCLYFPMATLGAQAFGSLRGALPHIVFPALARAMPGYLLAFVALVVGFVLSGVAQEYAARIPYAGWLIPAVVALYSLMFQARLIGLIYRDKWEKLGWE